MAVTQVMPVNIGVSDNVRKEIADALSRLLADTYTLFLKTQNFHWNVTGPLFHDLHELFELQYEELADKADELAERIRALGFPAPATFEQFTRLASIHEEQGVPKGEEMLRILVDGHEVIVRNVRNAMSKVDQGHDMATHHLLSDHVAFHEKTAWMLRSMLG